MHTIKLCASRKSVEILSLSPASFLIARIHFDANLSGGRPASLKHFGFNVSPPLEF